jgi:hypothetical protein
MHQILQKSRYAIVFYGILMGVISIILNEIGLNLGWVYLFMGIIIGSAVFPMYTCLSWNQVPAIAAISGAHQRFCSTRLFGVECAQSWQRLGQTLGRTSRPTQFAQPDLTLAALEAMLLIFWQGTCGPTSCYFLVSQHLTRIIFCGLWHFCCCFSGSWWTVALEGTGVSGSVRGPC